MVADHGRRRPTPCGRYCADVRSSSARLSSTTLTPGSPSTPKVAAVGVVVDHPADRADVEAALGGDPRRLQAGVGDRDVRVEARARRGHGVDGHQRIGGEAVLRAVGGDALLRPPSSRSGFVGPRFEPELAEPS